MTASVRQRALCAQGIAPGRLATGVAPVGSDGTALYAEAVVAGGRSRVRLEPPAQRVLGALIEKAMTTPQQYPLTLNALRSACNQRTGREPVVDWDEATVREGLDELKAQQLVQVEYARGSRTPRYAHRAGDQLDLTEAQHAILALLLLRGPQTPGELRARADRLYAFESLAEVEHTLDALASHRLLPLAARQPPRPGQKEARFAHLLGAEPQRTTTRHEQVAASDPTSMAADPTPPPAAPADADAITVLRDEVELLRSEVARLAAQVRELQSARGRPDAGGAPTP